LRLEGQQFLLALTTTRFDKMSVASGAIAEMMKILLTVGMTTLLQQQQPARTNVDLREVVLALKDQECSAGVITPAEQATRASGFLQSVLARNPDRAAKHLIDVRTVSPEYRVYLNQ